MKTFETPAVEIVAFAVEDVITTSTENDNAFGDSGGFPKKS